MMMGTNVVGTVAFCQHDQMFCLREAAKSQRELQAWVTKTAPPGQEVYFLEECGTDHAVCRNNIANHFLGDWVLQLDCDHVYEPDILWRMLKPFDEQDLDILTGIYFQKQVPHLPLLYQWYAPVEKFQPITGMPSGRIFTMPGMAAGGGCLLVRRRVFERIGSATPFDRIPGISEDLSFFRRVHEAGIAVWCYPDVVCGHLTKRVIGPADFAPYKDRLPGREIELQTERA